MNNPLNGFIPQERQPRNLSKLEPGVYHMTIERVIITDDNSLINGEPMTNVDSLKCWTDTNPVVYVYMVSPSGVLHYRLYWFGYKKWNDILRDPKYNSEIEKYRMPHNSACRPYAINKETNERIIDEALSQFCRNLLEEFVTAAGTPGQELTAMIGHDIWLEIADEFRSGNKYQKVVQVSDKEIIPSRKQQSSRAAAQPIRISDAELNNTWTM
jgi:hypothetical protein